MKRFAVINQHNEVESIHDEHRAAHEAALASAVDVHVSPIMTVDDWHKTHADFSGTVRGKPYVLYLDSQHGTCYSPCYLIEAWDAWQTRTSDKRLHKRYALLVVTPEPVEPIKPVKLGKPVKTIKIPISPEVRETLVAITHAAKDKPWDMTEEEEANERDWGEGEQERI